LSKIGERNKRVKKQVLIKRGWVGRKEEEKIRENVRKWFTTQFFRRGKRKGECEE